MALVSPVYLNTTTGKPTRIATGTDAAIATAGGTGQVGYTTGQILYADTTTSLAKLGIGSTGQALVVSAGLPAWGVALIAGGGTGLSSYTSGDILYYNSGTALSKLGIGSAGQSLIVSGGLPAWGVALIAGGGTGQSSYSAGDMLYYASGTSLSKLTIGTANYVLTSTGTAPSWLDYNSSVAGTVLTNNSGGSIAKFSAVYMSAAGEITKARADSTTTSEVIGITAAAISNSSTGNVLTETGAIITGTTGEWDAVAGTTGGLTFKTRYYLSTATAGLITSTVPSTAGHSVFLVGCGVSTTQLMLTLELIVVL